MLARDAHKAIVIRYFEEVWNERKLELIEELITPSFVGHEQNSPDIYGPTSILQVAHTFFRNFPNAVFTILDSVVEGDTVALRLGFQATNRETGRPVQVAGLEFLRLNNGKIAETWSSWNEFGMFQQMGGRLMFDEPSP